MDTVGIKVHLSYASYGFDKNSQNENYSILSAYKHTAAVRSSCNKNSRSSYVTHIVNSSLTLLGIRLCFEQINSDDEDCKQTESLKLTFLFTR